MRTCTTPDGLVDYLFRIAARTHHYNAAQGRRHSTFALAMLLVCGLFINPAFGQDRSRIPPIVGVFTGTSYAGARFFVSVDRLQRVGFATPQALLACDEAVKVLLGSGDGFQTPDGSVVVNIEARCPDKSLRDFDLRLDYDNDADILTLTLPHFPLFPPVEMVRIDFDPDVFYSAIQDIRSESSLVMHSLFESFDNQYCPEGTVAVAVEGGLLQCSEPPPVFTSRYSLSAESGYIEYGTVEIACDEGDAIVTGGYSGASAIKIISSTPSKTADADGVERDSWSLLISNPKQAPYLYPKVLCEDRLPGNPARASFSEVSCIYLEVTGIFSAAKCNLGDIFP